MIANKEHIEALLFEKIAGTISEEDNLVVENAISNDHEIKKQWEEIQAKLTTSKATAFLANLDEDVAWQNTQQHFTAQPIVRKFNYKKVATIAAIFVLAIPAGWFFLNQQSKLSAEETIVTSKHVYLKTDDGQLVEISANRNINIGDTKLSTTGKELSYKAADETGNSWATLVVPPTKDYKIKLADGTEVWLNAASSLRFPFQFGAKSREVYLKGEAYFQVAKNKDQEFIVHTDYADIKVHGTTFNVNAYNEENFTTALVEGSVSATKDTQQIKLKPGEKAIFTKNMLKTAAFDSQEVLGWMKGTYFFHNQSIKEIAPVIGRWFDVKVNWEQTGVADQTFTGEIDKGLPLSVVISNLQISSGIKAELKEGILTFK